MIVDCSPLRIMIVLMVSLSDLKKRSYYSCGVNRLFCGSPLIYHQPQIAKPSSIHSIHKRLYLAYVVFVNSYESLSIDIYLPAESTAMRYTSSRL